MTGIVPEARHREKEQIRKQIRSCGDANLRIRFLILCNLWAGRFVEEIVEVLQTSRSNVYRTAARYREDGEEGLIDGRRNNGKRKVDAAFRGALFEVVNKTPLDHGWRRPTWTRELLVETLVRKTGVRIHPSTMSHVLKSIGARRGAARPVVGCPWSKTAKNKRLREIRQLIKTLPGDEVAFMKTKLTSI